MAERTGQELPYRLVRQLEADLAVARAEIASLRAKEDLRSAADAQNPRLHAEVVVLREALERIATGNWRHNSDSAYRIARDVLSATGDEEVA